MTNLLRRNETSFIKLTFLQTLGEKQMYRLNVRLLYFTQVYDRISSVNIFLIIIMKQSFMNINVIYFLAKTLFNWECDLFNVLVSEFGTFLFPCIDRSGAYCFTGVCLLADNLTCELNIFLQLQYYSSYNAHIWYEGSF